MMRMVMMMTDLPSTVAVQSVLCVVQAPYNDDSGI